MNPNLHVKPHQHVSVGGFGFSHLHTSCSGHCMRKGDSHHLSACQHRILLDLTWSPPLFSLFCFCDIMVVGLFTLLLLLEDHGLKGGLMLYSRQRAPHGRIFIRYWWVNKSIILRIPKQQTLEDGRDLILRKPSNLYLAHVCILNSLSCLTLCDPMDFIWPTRLLCPWDSPGQNIGVGCHGLLQGIFLTQESNSHLLCLLLWQTDSLPQAPSSHSNTVVLNFCSTWTHVSSTFPET